MRNTTDYLVLLIAVSFGSLPLCYVIGWVELTNLEWLSFVFAGYMFTIAGVLESSARSLKPNYDQSNLKRFLIQPIILLAVFLGFLSIFTLPHLKALDGLDISYIEYLNNLYTIIGLSFVLIGFGVVDFFKRKSRREQEEVVAT